MTTPESTMQLLVACLVSVKPSLDASSIHPRSSLTADLGLDSLDLVELTACIRNEHGSVDLTSWLAQAVKPGGDTVGSLAVFVCAAADSYRVEGGR